jgi:hypothetical protein
MVEWLTGLPGALPEIGRALYNFGDPQNLGRGWVGGAIMLLWFGPLTALPLYIAKKVHGTHEWVSSAMGVMAGTSVLWWIHGVLPHAWIQFTESNANLLADRVIPASAGITVGGTRIDIASNLYAVITEGIVGGLMVGGIVVTIILFLRVQRMLPTKTLAPGETKPESGGYK